MKRLFKILIPSIAISAISVLAVFAAKDQAYISGIPKKYLLDGDIRGSDSYFTFYELKTSEYAGKYAVSLNQNPGKNTQVQIPKSFNGQDVIGIYRNGFSNYSNLNIIIPDTIQVIDYEAFMNTKFTNTSLVIPYSMEKLGTAAFFNTNLSSVIFADKTSESIPGLCTTPSTQAEDDSDQELSKLKTIPDFCFAKCSSLSSITFSNALESIQEEAFEYCSNLKTVAFLSGLKSLGERAFNCCENLSQVYLPNSLITNGQTSQNVGDFPFSNCNSKLNIQVSASDTECDAFKTSNPKAFRQSEYTPDNYKTTTIAGDVYANGTWLYSEQTLNGDNETSVKLMKYLGEIPANGIMGLPNTINSHSVKSIDKDNWLTNNQKQLVTKMFLPIHLDEIPDHLFNDKFDKLTYVGAMAESGNCYSDNDDNAIDLSTLSDLKKIGNKAFAKKSDGSNSGNNNLQDKVTKIKLPNNLKLIDDDAFAYFSKVTEFTIEDNRTSNNSFSIGKRAFTNLGYSSNNMGTIDLLLPNETILLDENSFYYANGIRSLEIEGGSDSNALSINKEAFKNCVSLEKLTIRDRGQKSINLGYLAFANWTDRGDYFYEPTLQFAYLPNNTNISSNGQIFDRQNRLTIYYGGTTLKSGDAKLLGSCFDDAEGSVGPNDYRDTLMHANSATKFNFSFSPKLYQGISLDNQDNNFVFADYDLKEKNETADEANTGFTYILNPKSKTAILTKYHFDMRYMANQTKLIVTIPETVKGPDKINYTVTEIGDQAFVTDDSYKFTFQFIQNYGKAPIETDGQGQDISSTTFRTISKVVLPNTIKRIGHYAFFRCVGLEEIGTDNGSMPDKLTEIGEHAFSFTGIKTISNLKSSCKFTFTSSDSTDFNKSSPFMNCPNLSSITLNTTISGTESALLKVDADNKCLKDINDNIWVVYPGCNPSDKSFISDKNFHYGAFKAVKWIEDLTISNYPKTKDTITPQALFIGLISQQKIRYKCCYKGRIKEKGEGLDCDVTLKTLRLKQNSDGNLTVPANAFMNTTIEKIILPYGKGNGTIPAKLLDNIQYDDYNSETKKGGIIIQVEKNEAGTVLSNSGEDPTVLDLEDCGYTTIATEAFKGLNFLKTLKLKGITTIGNSAFEDSSVTSVDMPNVQNIGNSAFKNSPVTTVNMPNVKNIGDNAFYGGKLTDLKLPTSLESMGKSCFAKNATLTSVDFQSNANSNFTAIPNYAFEDCNLLETVKNLPTNLNTIGEFAFHNCTRLNSFGKDNKIWIPKTVTSIGQYAFQIYEGKFSEIEFEENPSELSATGSTKLVIGQGAFDGVKSISNLYLTGRRMEIGNSAFQNTKLTSVTIGKGVTYIGNFAFSGLSSLTSLTFEEGTLNLKIDSSAFSSTGLTSLSLTGRPMEIGSSAFSNCKSLSKIDFSNATSLTSIGVDAFSGTIISSVDFSNCTSLTTVGGFQNCALLTEVILPPNVTTIGDNAFKGCSSLTKVAKDGSSQAVLLPSTVNSIGQSAFEYTPITFVKLEGSIVSIGSNAFASCESLIKFIVLSSSETGSFNYGQTIFNGCSNLILIVLPSNFNMDSTTLLVGGLNGHFGQQQDGYICIDQQFSGSLSGKWAYLDDSGTSISKVAYKDSTNNPTYTWAWKDNNTKNDVTTTEKTATAVNSIQLDKNLKYSFGKKTDNCISFNLVSPSRDWYIKNTFRK